MISQVEQLIKQSRRIVFMTGAGVSTPSGIPDYRSMSGVYQGIDNPEYLLSNTCLLKEPEKFYSFVKQLYHVEAKPNVIHLKMKELEQTHDVTIITQNIDCLHEKAGSQNIVNFHGNLYDCFCMTCQKNVPVDEYLKSDRHLLCGAQVRPNVILYEENLPKDMIEQAVSAIEQADLLVIVGTSFKVYPFSGLINYRNKASQLAVINREQIELNQPYLHIKGPAEDFFERL